jgi:hypothetical protein
VLALLKRPGGWIPIAMSLAALGLVLLQLALHGKEPQGDEGAAAHLFQMLLIGQLPVIAFFAMRWLPRKPKDALRVLALQAVAGIAPLVSIAVLGW